MTADTTSVLVTGATGNQGGAVVEHLLASDTEFDVHGLTRSVDSERAQQLVDRGVTMVEGNLNDPESFRSHVAAVDAVFAVTNFWTEGYDAQVQQGKHLADVAAEEAIEQFVFSGVGSHWEETGVPHFDSAAEIDQYTQSLDLPLTVLRSGVFLSESRSVRREYRRRWHAGVAARRRCQPTDGRHDDVGRAAAVAFEHPEEYVGERFSLAGDERTLAETAAAIAEVSGHEVEAYHVPIEDAYESFGEEFTVMCEWFNEVGYSADIDALAEQFGFSFTTLEEYLRENGWEDKDEMASTPGWVKAL